MGRLFVVVGLFAVLACSGLQAQTTMTANIPFDFQLGKSTMAAGGYRISYSPHLVTFQSKDGHSYAGVLTLPADRRKPTEEGVLRFNRYGDTYFLSGVWAPS